MRVLVTGGGGFLGRAVCRRLAEAGHQVRALNRRPRPGPDAHGVEQRTGDIRCRADVLAAADGCDAVVHCAAMAGAWGPVAEYHAVNVLGTRHVLDACQELGVTRLVYTSSPSVVHNGTDLNGVDESAPYATRWTAPYPRTKALAERMVLAANSPRLATVALRPHIIWGPGDPHFLPRLADRARRGRLYLVGDASRLIDTVYIDNAADAHLLAVERLSPGAPIAGRPYFITQGDPRPIGEIVRALVAAAGGTPRPRPLPVAVARPLATAVESAYRLLGVRREPPLTRFLVEQFTTAHWFTIEAARRDLGYRPRVSIEEGLAVLGERLRARS